MSWITQHRVTIFDWMVALYCAGMAITGVTILGNEPGLVAINYGLGLAILGFTGFLGMVPTLIRLRKRVRLRDVTLGSLLGLAVVTLIHGFVLIPTDLGIAWRLLVAPLGIIPTSIAWWLWRERAREVGDG